MKFLINYFIISFVCEQIHQKIVFVQGEVVAG